MTILDLFRLVRARQELEAMPPIPPGSVVAHGGNPLGASLSLWEKTALPHQNLKFKI
ncbi:hypothetical protein [Nostoc sp.]|uniref:hypothetical protein n=1 Tax=Nostoc sp. TaxID=1180 RepID=UPI002FF8112C